MPSPPNPTPSLPITNGHLSPLAANVINADASLSQSESDLSDVKEPAAEDGFSSEAVQENSYMDDADGGITSETSEDVDAEGEADGDYDSETPPPRDEEDHRSRSSSAESRRPVKRKASVEDDEHITQNPELYGLRRSGRARPNRRIVDSDDSDEDSTAPRAKRQKMSFRKASRRATPTVQSDGLSESNSDDEDYFGAKKNAPTKKQRQRQLKVAAGLLPPSRSEVRFSSRRTQQITTYNEDEDEDMFEDDAEDDMTPNYWANTVEDDSPAIDKVLDHRPKDGIEIDPSTATKKDFDYLIKWQDKAHYHSTWEAYDTIATYRGFRKLDNYYKGPVTYELVLQARQKQDPEEYEQYMIQREAERESLTEHHTVDRVIGSRQGEDETEYYVKWKGLPYDLCTWESATLVSSLSQYEIDRYLDRSSRLPISDSKESNIATRKKFVTLKEQPDYIKHGQLRSFQLTGLNFLAHHWCKGTNVILADEMGLGKTVQTVSFMNWLRHDRRQEGPFICVVPLSTMPAWADTFNNWTPDVNYIIYTGGEAARKIIQEHELLVDGNPKKVKFNVLVTTYEYVLKDWEFLASLKWQFLAVDEAHRLKNRDSQLYNRLVNFNAPSRLLITGTPIQNTLGELAALMDFLMPGKIQVDESVDLSSEDASRKIAELSDAIKPFMIRRTKEKVENDLPPKSEKILRVELSDIQLEYYKNILTRNYEALNEGSNGQKQSLLNIVMELKKASNHPLLFPNLEAKLLKENAAKDETLRTIITTSGKMMLLDQLLTKLKKDGHRVLIFSQMVHMLDILTNYLRLRNYSYQRLDGTVPAAARKIAIDHFNAPGSDDYCFLLSTRAGGLGINLMTADTVILFDSDWNPQADLQAMARAHRIGQKNPVSVYRMVSKDTIEEEILERARNKRMLEFITIQRGVTDRENKDLTDKINRATGEPNSADDINRILKRRGQKMFEQSGNQKKLEELDIDAVLENAEEHKTEQAPGLTSDGGEDFLKNFEYTDVKLDLDWDDIIPKDELDQVKAGIQQRKEEEETRKLLEESAPRKRKAADAEEREQRAAKKRAREAQRELREADGGNSGDDDSSQENSDPKRPLDSKETRNLIRAYERYGSFEERRDEIVREAKLVGRDQEILKATLDEVVNMSQNLLKADQARLEKLETDSKKVLTKKDKKAVLFDFRGVKKLNAETLTERPLEMRMLRDATNAASDWRNFRIPEAIKPASYTCPWGAREDGMLCVGIAKHGYGAWTAIRDDPELGMSDKFYLEEQRVDKKEERSKNENQNAKSPGAVHLVRRANYLLTVLKEKTGSNPNAKRLIENHHRNNKKHPSGHRRPDKSTSVSASPAPSNAQRKVARDSERPSIRPHSNSENRLHDNRPDSRQHGHTQTHGHASSEHRHRPSEHRRIEHRSTGDRRPNPERTATPEIRRHASGENEKPRYREPEERHGHQHRRSVDAKSPNGIKKDDKGDDYLERRVRPMREHLQRLRHATSKNFPIRDQLIKVLKAELIAVGNFIEQETREQPSVNTRLWGYVVQKYWPAKAETHAIRRMYDNILQKELGGNAGGASAKTGQTNGA